MKHEKSTTLFVSKEGKIVGGPRSLIPIPPDIEFPEKALPDPDLIEPPSGFARLLCGIMVGALGASFYWVIFIWLRYLSYG